MAISEKRRTFAFTGVHVLTPFVYGFYLTLIVRVRVFNLSLCSDIFQFN